MYLPSSSLVSEFLWEFITVVNFRSLKTKIYNINKSIKHREAESIGKKNLWIFHFRGKTQFTCFQKHATEI